MFAPRFKASCLTCIVIAATLRPALEHPAHSAAILALQASSSPLTLPGQTATFDVFLRGYQEPFPIVSFALNVNASDAGLTSGGTDFTRFGFSLDSLLLGSIGGLAIDANVADDGRVEFAADLPPFGTQTGIPPAAGDVRLGTLSVLAPNQSGIYAVSLLTTPSEPIFGGGSFLLIDDSSEFGLVLPGDGTLTIGAASLTVVPEPDSFVLAGIGAVAACFVLRFRQRARKHSHPRHRARHGR